MLESGIMLAFLRVLLIIVVPLALLLVSVDLIASRGFAHHEYSLSDFPPSIIFDDSARREFSEVTIRYVRSRESPDLLRGLEYKGVPIYTEREVQHLVDVQRVLRMVLVAEKIALAIVLGALVRSEGRITARTRRPV